MGKEPSLYNHYLAARTSLLRAGEKATSRHLREAVELALFQIEVAMKTFEDLAGSLPLIIAYSERELKEYRERSNDVVGSISVAQDAVDFISWPDLRQKQQDLLSMVAHLQKESLYSESHLQEATLIFFEVAVAASCRSLHEVVLDTGEGIHAVNALRQFIDYLIGLSPIGWLTDGLQRIRTILLARSEPARAADQFLSGLEAKALVASMWCLSTQYLIDSIHSLDSAVETTPEAVEARLRARADAIADQLERRKQER